MTILRVKTQKVDTSTQVCGVGSDYEMDYTSEFSPSEIVNNRESLIQWACEAGKRNGFVVVTIGSDLDSKGMISRVTLGCERGGRCRQGKNGKQRGGIDPKKCGCPFTLKGEKLESGDEWMLKVVCGVHNHAIAEYLEGHSISGRLKRSYNARKRQRVEEKTGRPQTQQLFGKLHDYNYIEWHRNCPNSESVLDLFCAHPVSLKLLRAFPRILIMSCSTNKTDKYHYPLLEIVGVTSTNMTFSVAHVILDSEKEDNYIWALGRLRGVMEGCAMPCVIVTKRDLELIRAIEIVFPTTRHLLCKCHVNKNVWAKCRNMFKSKEEWYRFSIKWNEIVTSPTEDDYIQKLGLLQSEFNMYTEALEYVINTWLNPFKDRFVSAWTDKVMHFGNLTTNRAEIARANLNKQLGLSQENFESSFTKINGDFIVQHTEIKASFEKSRTLVPHSLRPSEFGELREFVSHHALDKVLSESKRANVVGLDALACGCIIRRTHGLPCVHELAEYKREGRPIPIESINSHWRKLDMEAPPSEPPLELLQQYSMESNAERNKLMARKKVGEFIAPKTRLVEPEVSPKNKVDQQKLRSTCKDPSAFELVLSEWDDYSFNEGERLNG